MKITIDQFHGESPRTASHLLTHRQATQTSNCDVRGGNLNTATAPTELTSSLNDTKSIHLYNADGVNPTWFESELDLNYVKGPLPNDTEERVYITGQGAPRITYASIATQGTNGPYPSVTRILGVPAPEIAPSVSIDTSTPATTTATGFAATATVGDDGEIAAINLTSGGSGYTGVLSAVVKDNVPVPVEDIVVVLDGSGTITAVTLPTDPAALSGFKKENTTISVVDSHKWGSGAELSLEWDVNGVISGVTVDKGGVSYPTETTAKITATGGEGCRLKVLATDGVIQPLQIVTAGSGYTNPTIEVTSNDIDTNAIPVTRAYVYTFVTEKGEEGPPSPPSTLFDWMPGQILNIAVSQPTVSETNYAISKLRIYRYAQGGVSGAYLYVGELLVGDESFIDDLEDLALPGGMLATSTFDPPPEDMQGLISLSNGVMAGFSGKEVCFCEPYLPYAWPVNYRLTVDYEIVGLGALGNGVAVLTKGQPYLIIGSHPSAMGMDKLDIDQACVSKRSIVSDGGAVAFASPDGLFFISSNESQNVTKSLMTREQWQALNPSTILGVLDEGRYLGFYDGVGSFTLDPNEPNSTLTFSDTHADAVFRDRMSDQLYIVDHRTEPSGETALWKSKNFILPTPSNFSALRVLGEGTCTVRVLADGVERFNSTIETGEIYRLPGGFLAQEWALEVSNLTQVDQIDMSTALTEMHSA